mgnify:CR=1 FL=1
MITTEYGDTTIIQPSSVPPTFSVGTLVDPISITLTHPDPAVSIHYTTNGSTPTASSTLYSSPFAVTGSPTWTLKAIAVYPSGTTSAVAVAAITRSVVATPTFSQAAGTYYESVAIAISCATAGVTMRYTTDGSTPTTSHGTVYSGEITLTSSADLKAVAYKTGYTTSNIKTDHYTMATYRMYWGASESETLNQAAVFALANKNNTEFSTSPTAYAFGANTPDKYLYLVMHDGESLQPVQDTPQPGFMTGGLTMAGDLADTGTYTEVENTWNYATVFLFGSLYRVYRTKNLIAAAISITVTRGAVS